MRLTARCASSRYARHADPRGFALVEVVIALFLLLIVTGVVLIGGARAVRNSARVADIQAARTAALARIHEPFIASPGGTVWPATPVEGYSDTVVIETDGGPPARVLRQWTVAGSRLATVELSAVAVDEQGQALGEEAIFRMATEVRP